MAEPDHYPAPADTAAIETARAWATKTCAAQGLPVKIAAGAILAAIATQLTAGQPTPTAAR